MFCLFFIRKPNGGRRTAKIPFFYNGILAEMFLPSEYGVF